MKSSTKFFIFFLIFAVISIFLTLYPNILILLPFDFPYVEKKVEGILQIGAYLVTAQALLLAIIFKIRRH